MGASAVTLLLGRAGDWWDLWMIVSLACVALAGAAVVVFTLGSVIVHKRESRAAAIALARYKSETAGKVADARAAGIEAGKTAGDALVKAATLEREAQELKAANLALQLKIQPRRLTGEDSRSLSAALSKLQPRPIGIVSRLLDPESADFADDLANAFRRARWEAVRISNWTMSDKGVSLATLEGTAIPPNLAAALREALAASDIRVTTTTITKDKQNTIDPHFQPEVLYLLVGVKL